MTKELLLKDEVKLQMASSKRPKSLKTRIPISIRDKLDLKKDDTLIMELYSENGEKYVKMYKKIE